MPEIRYLFRFRDLVAPTLIEHNKIIGEKGSCWWGWWKRPSEDARQDVWQALCASASRETPVSIGLFHSGTGHVYEAIVVEIIEPQADTGSVQTHPPVPKEEEELIPPYYRKSPFSYAWMKLIEIAPEPMDFFDRYSFGSLPKLPNYSSRVLSRFVGKVILDPDELRGMDTTIWEVRNRRAADTAEKIILTIPALPQPVSAQPIKVSSSKILHITDPHFAVGANRDQHVWRLEGKDNGSDFTLVEAIEKALGGDRIGLVLVTGDLTFTGLKKEFDAAATSIIRLLATLDLSPDNLVVVPGNHDIRWTTDAIYNHSAKVKTVPAKARKNYEAFYRKVFRHDPNKYLAMGRRYLLPEGVAVEVCGLNSSSLQTGKNFLAGVGRVDEAAFQTVSSELGWTDGSTLALRILALHHHLALTENLESYGEFARGFGIAVDAPRIQRMAAKKGVQLAIHGHKHRAFIWRSSVYELPEDAHIRHQLGQISIVGGGSAGSKDTDGRRNFFNIIDVTPEGLLLTIFRSQNRGAFEKMQEWRAEFAINKEHRHLVLGEWIENE